MKTTFIGGCLILALSGCQQTRIEPSTGTELTTDSHGNGTMTTFVSEAEYQRMSPEERALVHAGVGVNAEVAHWGPNSSAAPITPLSNDELNKALTADAAQQAYGRK